MKRTTTIWLVILIVFLCGIGALIYWQWNTITAVWYAFQYTPEQTQQLEQQNQQVMQEIADQFPGVDVSLLPDEAREMLSKGELSEETAAAIITGKITWEEVKVNPSAAAVLEEPSHVDDIVARIYVLRSGYTGRVDSLIAQALADYRANKGTESELMTQYVGKGYALEAECDAQIEALLSELSAELKRTGGDMGLVSQIRTAYQQEKSLKKAAIIAKYKK